MATYTLILNERFSGAKKLLEFLKSLNFVEIQPNNTKESSSYDQEFVKKIERSRSSKGKKIKIDDLWK